MDNPKAYFAALTADYAKLQAETRAFTLVGAFIGHFALLEESLGDALGQALGVEKARLWIVTRNMTFDDKVKTMRTLVDRFIIKEDRAKHIDSLCLRARKFGEMRNIIAHSPFRASLQSDGVEFLVVSANSKLKFPEMDWELAKFVEVLHDLNALDDEFRALEVISDLDRIAYELAAAPEASEAGMAGAILSQPTD